MRQRGGRDLNPHPRLRPAPADPRVSWLPVRLRLRLDHLEGRGRGCWQLVDLGAESEGGGWGLNSQVAEGK